MRPALATLLLCGALLPGCSGSPVTITAMQAQDAADGAAMTWNSAAFLTGMVAVEPGLEAVEEARREAANESDGGEARRERDEGERDHENDEEAWEEEVEERTFASPDRPGDGRARYWIAVYSLPDDSAQLNILVDSRGRVSSFEEAAPREGDGIGSDFGRDRIDNWTIDSDDAAELAAEANSTWEQHQGDPAALTFDALFMGDEDPYWLLVMEVDGNESVFLTVNARNGTVSDLGLLFLFPWLGLYREGGTLPFSLSAVEPTATAAFQVSSDAHSKLVLDLYVERGVPLSEVSATITDPSGTAYEMSVQVEPGQLMVEDHIVTAEVPPGEYSVEVRLDGGATQSFEVSWCTDGISFAFPFPGVSDSVEACSHLDA